MTDADSGSAPPAVAEAVTVAVVVAPPSRGGQQVAASCGYVQSTLDFPATEFPPEPSVLRGCAHPEAVATWRDVPGFADQPAAQTVLQPLGYQEATTLPRSAPSAVLLGVLHVSFPDPTAFGQARTLLGATWGPRPAVPVGRAPR